MIRPFKLGNKFVLATGFKTVGGSGITGSRSASSRSVDMFELSWTGERWWQQGGKQFDSEEAALAYLDEHENMMQEALQNA